MNKNTLLWVVSVGALCLSLLAIFGPKLQGVKSQAASIRYTPSLNQTISPVNTTNPVVNNVDIYVDGVIVSSDEMIACIKDLEDDGLTGFQICIREYRRINQPQGSPVN